MLNKNFFISLIVFLIFLIFTSVIKTETRKIEKNILAINKKNNILEKNLHEIQVDYFYLTSPSSLSKKIKKYSDQNYENIDYSKIFISLEHFTQYKNKTTKFLNYEKKLQKK